MQKVDIKRLRNEKNITQVELANLTGYPQSFISKMENGNEPTPEAFIEKVKETLNIRDIKPYQVGRDDSKSRIKASNVVCGKNAKWQNGSSDYTVQRLLEMLERWQNKIDEKEAKIEEKDAEIAELRCRIFELEAQIRNSNS
jgi:transcriptional regulator with XRE-family HTH domain